MTRLLIGLGIFLIAWGAFVLVTGDFVATVDIAAGLVASGIGVIGLSAIIRSLDRIANLLAERNELGVSEQRVMQAPQARPAAERPRAAPQPPPAEMPPAAAERRPSPAMYPQMEPLERPQPVERPQPEPERRPEPPVEPRRPAPAAVETGPKLIREGVIEGQQYRFYDDGSIEAEGPGGLRRFRSIEEAREQIMRDRAVQPLHQGQPPQPSSPPQAQKPPAPDTRRPPEEAPRPPRAPAESEPAQRGPGKPEQDLTWDAYLSGGRKSEGEPPRLPEDDQWSEPFRMLLRGDAPPPDQKPDQKPPKR